MAIRYERLDVADLLRAQGGEIGTIHGVARNGYLASVQAHLDAGVDINARDKNGSTPLHWAARYGQKQVVELLISRNAEVNARDNSGSTPLDRATQGNHADIADLLRAQGGETGTIHVVAKNGYLAGVQAHLDAGVDINARDKNGSTPLHWAALEGHREIVELLISRNAEVNARDNTSNTPLDLAIRYERLDIADLLRAQGGNTSIELITLINYAKNGDLDGVQIYLDKGVNINAKDNNDWTALHWAALEDYKKIVELLIDNGAQINATDSLGDTPLDFAKGEIKKLLRLRGGKTGMELTLMPQLTYGKGLLIIDGWIGLKYEVLYSSNLKKWQILDTITIKESQQVYIDVKAKEDTIRFYQLRLTD